MYINIIQNYIQDNIYILIISLFFIMVVIYGISIRNIIIKYDKNCIDLELLLNTYKISNNDNLLKYNNKIDKIVAEYIEKYYDLRLCLDNFIIENNNKLNDINLVINNKDDIISAISNKKYCDLKLFLDHFIIENNIKLDNINENCMKNSKLIQIYDKIEDNYIHPRYVYVQYKQNVKYDGTSNYRNCTVLLTDTTTKYVNIIFNFATGYHTGYDRYSVSINDLYFYIGDFDIHRFSIYRYVKILSFDQPQENNNIKVWTSDIIKMYDTIVPDILSYVNKENIILDILIIKHNIGQYVLDYLIQLTNYKQLQIKKNTIYKFKNELKIHCETNNIILECIL